MQRPANVLWTANVQTFSSTCTYNPGVRCGVLAIGGFLIDPRAGVKVGVPANGEGWEIAAKQCAEGGFDLLHGFLESRSTGETLGTA